jgi:hypothetical protein
MGDDATVPSISQGELLRTPYTRSSQNSRYQLLISADMTA